MCTILSPKMQVQSILITGNLIACLKLVSLLNPFLYMALNHEKLCLGLRVISAVIMISSMILEIITTGRNCSQGIANFFTTREIGIRSNTSDLFQKTVDSPRSSFLIMMLMITFVSFSIGVATASAKSKKKMQKEQGHMVKLKKNLVMPFPTRSQEEQRNRTRKFFVQGEDSKRNLMLQPKSILENQSTTSGKLSISTLTSNVASVDSTNTVTAGTIAQLLGSSLEQVSILNLSLIQTGVQNNQVAPLQIENLRLPYSVDSVEKKESFGSMMAEMATNTSAFIIYNLIFLQIMVFLKDYTLVTMIGYSYFKAVFDTTPLFIILRKGPIFTIVKRRLRNMFVN